jgi:hypothetical protein
VGAREPAPATASTDTDPQDPARACGIDLGPVQLAGDLAIPLSPIGIVVFAHGSGSSRHSPRNRQVAHLLNHSRLATPLVDLLTPAEEGDRAKVFDIELLAGRLGRGDPLAAGPARGPWPPGRVLRGQHRRRGRPVGQRRPRRPGRGGGVPRRPPPPARPRLGEVRAPTLLVVGGHDQLVLERNRQAQAQLRGLTILQVIAGAGHLFEEPGALDRVAALAAAWFRHQLSRTSPAGPGQTPRDPSEPSSRTDTVLQG